MLSLAELTSRTAGPGQVDWIGLRPERRGAIRAVEAALLLENGFEGDHSRAGKRAVTLLQAEHLPVIETLARNSTLTPALLRRNILISGLNLSAFRQTPLRIGAATVQITTPCAPCSRMEEALGHGGYNAMRGHGGWCAEVLEPGMVRMGDTVCP